MTTLAPSFLIGFTSFLQVTTTLTKSRMNSKFDQIRTLELPHLAALERLEFMANLDDEILCSEIELCFDAQVSLFYQVDEVRYMIVKT